MGVETIGEPCIPLNSGQTDLMENMKTLMITLTCDSEIHATVLDTAVKTCHINQEQRKA